MSGQAQAARTRAAIAIWMACLLVAGALFAAWDNQPVHAHEVQVTEIVSGAGRCPANVRDCKETWVHVNNWIHYSINISPGCAVAVVYSCGVTITSVPATSSCRTTSGCGHGPHHSTPRPAGPGSWSVWKGHYNTNYRWRGRRIGSVPHTHQPAPASTPAPQIPTPQPTPPPPPVNPAPGPAFNPEEVDWRNFNPCANSGCAPACLTDGIPGNCPWEAPPKKACTTSWSSATRQRLRSALRWESVVPYNQGFTGHHHPEAPGGKLYLTVASSPSSPARHWVAQQPGTTLNVVDAPQDGCLWTATAVGVSLRELLAHQPSDLSRLRRPGAVAAAREAREAASLWDRLSQERKRWYALAFPRNDPATTWCSPAELPPWTAPAVGVLSLSEDWERRYDKCRWPIPRRGFWEWRLQIKYTSEENDLHTETVAKDLSWFRESNGYLGDKVTLW